MRHLHRPGSIPTKSSLRQIPRYFIVIFCVNPRYFRVIFALHLISPTSPSLISFTLVPLVPPQVDKLPSVTVPGISEQVALSSASILGSRDVRFESESLIEPCRISGPSPSRACRLADESPSRAITLGAASTGGNSRFAVGHGWSAPPHGRPRDDEAQGAHGEPAGDERRGGERIVAGQRPVNARRPCPQEDQRSHPRDHSRRGGKPRRKTGRDKGPGRRVASRAA